MRGSSRQAETGQGTRLREHPALPYLFCLAIALLFAWRIVFLAWQPLLGDIRFQFLPWKAFAREALAGNRVPLWNPYTYGGCPFLANLQSAVFYPVDLLLYCFPIEYLFGYSLVLHMVLSLWLMLLLSASCGLSRWASCVAACAYGLNGFVMIHILFGNHLTYTAIAWAPGLLWAALRATQAPKLRGTDCAAFALLMSLQLLCGHPQMAFYAYFFTAIFIVAAGSALGWKATLRGLLAFAMGGLVAAGLCAFQIVPTLEYIPLSVRQSAINFDQATEFSFAPHRLVSLLAGEYFGSHIWGNHWDAFYYWSSAYGGAILPILAVIGAASWRSNRSLWRGLLVMGVVALFLACGRDNPLYRLVLTLPGFKYFRAPAKFLPWFILAVSLLGGRGLDWLAQHLRSLRRGDTLGRHPSSPGVTIFCGLAGAFIVARFLGHESAQTPEVIRIAACFVALGHVILATCWYAGARQFPRLRKSAFPAGIVVLLAADLWLFGHKYINSSLSPADSVWRWLVPPPEATVLHQLEKTSGPFRIAMVGDIAYPNMTIPWRLRGLSGYDPMSLRTTMDLLAASEAWPPDKFVDSVELKQLQSPIYDLFDIQYIIAPGELSDPNLDLVSGGWYLRVYRRKTEAQALRWVPEDEVTYRQPSGPTRTNDELLRLRWEHIELDAEPPPTTRQQTHGGDRGGFEANISSWGEQEIVARYKTSQDGWLVLSLPWYPGWEASIDGGVSQICVRAMHALSAIRVPSGEHEVRVIYHPRSWQVGCFISFGTGFLCALWVVWILVHRRRRAAVTPD
jgi:hypothetical protein